MITVPVRVPSGTYEVVVGEGLLDRAAEHLPDLPGAERAFVVADHDVAELYLDRLAGSLGLPTLHLTVPPGEEAKTLRTVEVLYEHLATQGAHRGDVVIALGGGSVGDTAGYVAATYMRGVPFVQVPTTLTAQVDAAVGGKVGVNLPRGKNLVGAFHHARAVLADVSTLVTLPEREFRSGLAEVAKYGLAVDPGILELIEGATDRILARDARVLTDLVAACVRAKAAVVAEDELDTGRRAVLNYGHTLGHALERLDDFHGVSHGEAVASGMVLAARLAASRGMIGRELIGRHRRVLAALGLPDDVPPVDPDAVLEAMRLDKKYRQGLRFALLDDVGSATVMEIEEDEVRAALAEGGS